VSNGKVTKISDEQSGSNINQLRHGNIPDDLNVHE
jgi:hypothetical protein